MKNTIYAYLNYSLRKVLKFLQESYRENLLEISSFECVMCINCGGNTLFSSGLYGTFNV